VIRRKSQGFEMEFLLYPAQGPVSVAKTPGQIYHKITTSSYLGLSTAKFKRKRDGQAKAKGVAYRFYFSRPRTFSRGASRVFMLKIRL
jgi:hypothetical protein